MLAHQKKQRQSYSRRIVSESDLKRFSRANSRRITVILDNKSGLISSSSSGSSTAVSGETPKIASKIEDYDIQKLNDIDDNDINNNNDDNDDNDENNNNNKGNDDNISPSSVSNPSTPRIFASKLENFNENNNNVNDVVNNPNQEDEDAIIHRQQQLLLSQHQQQQQQQLSPLNVINEVTVMDVNGKIVFHSLLRRKDVWFLDVSDLDAMDSDTVFQYVAHRSPPQPDLVLTRVPELRHLIYVKHDEEGRPYPIKMRKVVKAHTKKHMSGKLQEEIIQEEVVNEEHTITEEHFQQINAQKAPENTTVITKSRSLWDMFSISLIKTASQSTPSHASSTS